MRYEKFIRENFDVMGTSGPEFLCRCVFHQDGGKPNLYIHGEKGLYFCHSCGAKGHLTKVAGAIAQDTGVDLSDVRKRIRALKESLNTTGETSERRNESWLTQFRTAHTDYWTSRGFTKRAIRHFDLGYDVMDDVVTIPVRDELGNLVGVIRRVTDNSKPKYLNDKGWKKSEILFHANVVYDAMYPTDVVLVEGPLDVIPLWEAGVHAVAMFGTYLSERQTEILVASGTRRVILLTDNDQPGRNALPVLVEELRGMVDVMIGSYEGIINTDPGSFNLKDVRKALSQAVPWRHATLPELADIRYR